MATSSVAMPVETMALVKNVPVRLEVTRDSTQRLSIAVSAEQFLSLKVSPASAIVNEELFGPDHKQVAGADCPGNEKGSDWFGLIANAPGKYLLTLSPGAKAKGPQTVTVELTELRDPTESDRERWLGQTL